MALTAMAGIVMIGASGIAGASAAGLAHRAPAHAHFQRCPRAILPLSPDGVARAADRALAEAARLYRGLNTRGALVEASDRSAFAGVRGQQVTRRCGKKVAARTVVVQMLFPRELPSASLSQAVVWVGRFPHGFRVWFKAH